MTKSEKSIIGRVGRDGLGVDSAIGNAAWMYGPHRVKVHAEATLEVLATVHVKVCLTESFGGEE